MEDLEDREGPDGVPGEPIGERPRQEMDPDEFDGTTLVWYLREAWIGRERTAEWATWFGTGAYPGTGHPGIGREYSRPGAAWDATMVPELWGPWVNDAIRTGDIQYGLYEDVSIADDELVVRVRSDANWSNGDPVLGRDAVPLTLATRLAAVNSFETVAREGPRHPVEAITGVEWDGKVARFFSDGDWFGDFMDQDLWSLITRRSPARSGADGGQGGVMQHTRLEPYDAWFDRLVDLWEGAKTNSIDPWGGDVNLWRELVDALPDPPGDSWYEYFHEPANCVVTGAFKPASVEPILIVLERNPEFYAADRIDVDQVLFPLLDNLEHHWAALMAGDRDYLRKRTPEPAVEETPVEIEQRLVPAPTGWALGLNHQTKPFDSRAVRQAIMYALDTEALASNVHPLAYEPVTVPGGHAFRLRELLGDTFVTETLRAYPHDRELAADRMRAAGYQREDGTWVDDDGTPAEFPFMAYGRAGGTIAHSARTQVADFGFVPRELPFGIESAGAREAAWPIRVGVGFALPAVGELYRRLVRTESRAREFGVFPAEQIDAAEYGTEGYLRGSGEAFTIEAPPVGEPAGPLQLWNAPKLARECATAGSRSDYVETLRTLAWLYNWHLPVIPIANGYTQHFFDVDAWEWSDLEAAQFDGVGVAQLQPEDMIGLGHVQPK